MIIQKLRLEKGWSQELLAQLSGVSVRTIQRVEGGQKAGLETLKSLAAVFDINVATLTQEQTMISKASMNPDELARDAALKAGHRASHLSNNPETTNGPIGLQREEAEALEYVQNLKGFHLNWITALLVLPCLYALNIYLTPNVLWVAWAAAGWGLSLVLHALTMYGLFGVFNTKWERRAVEKRLNKMR
ncbi:MAG: 2TM domain-containing protein [Parvibaculaceae bacterium]|nr:2TM domain-containing protein [Parvibaculaceae bacterium]